jgi:5-amino-6-(5-phosphoribosylamino)uracil reductase
MTADGKIANVDRSAARFGSVRDKQHLERQIAAVDAVLFGAGTLRAYATTLTITDPNLLALRTKSDQPSQPIQIVCSASGQIDRHYRFFSQPVPRWLLTIPSGAASWQSEGNEFDRILVAATDGAQICWREALSRLTQLGIHKLAVLGGGELVASLLAIDAVDDLWLTVCPAIFGGRQAPTPVEGIGLNQMKKLTLLEVNCVAGEVFLHYCCSSL